MIEVEHLSKNYGSTIAIADLSFQVEPGEIMGFLGPNGAGKTTTMRILSGYLPASGGTARIAGHDVHEDLMAVRQKIGYLPETPPLYPEMTVEGYLYFVSRIKLVSAGDRDRQVTSAMQRTGLLEKRHVLIRKLSKGFKQRVGIAQAIVHDPPVIILDEPTVGLDPRQIIEVRNLIKSLAGQHTIILSTHILPEVSMTCNRVTIVNRGQVVATGSPDKLTGFEEGYELEVEGDEETFAGIVSSLENVPGVRSLELVAIGNSETRRQLRVACEPETEPGKEIVSAIVTAGLGLYEMRRTRPSLEDVFLKLTTLDSKKQPAAESQTEGEKTTTGETAAAGKEETTDTTEKPTLTGKEETTDVTEKPTLVEGKEEIKVEETHGETAGKTQGETTVQETSLEKTPGESQIETQDETEATKPIENQVETLGETVETKEGTVLEKPVEVQKETTLATEVAIPTEVKVETNLKETNGEENVEETVEETLGENLGETQAETTSKKEEKQEQITANQNEEPFNNQ